MSPKLRGRLNSLVIVAAGIAGSVTILAVGASRSKTRTLDVTPALRQEIYQELSLKPGKLGVILFSNYFCMPCRRLNEDMRTGRFHLREGCDLRVVNLPETVNPTSARALALLQLGYGQGDKGRAVHEFLMNVKEGSVDEVIADTHKRFGPETVKRDVAAGQLSRGEDIAHQLGIASTPSLVLIDDAGSFRLLKE